MWAFVIRVILGIGGSILSRWISRDPEKEGLKDALKSKEDEAARLAAPARDYDAISASLRRKAAKHMPDADIR